MNIIQKKYTLWRNIHTLKISLFRDRCPSLGIERSNTMNDSGFFLTYDLKILYCQSIQTASSLKQLILDTLAFMQYEGDKNVLLNSYALEGDEIETLTKQILMGKVGDELPEEDMKWIMDFEKLLKEDASLITNRDLAFN